MKPLIALFLLIIFGCPLVEARKLTDEESKNCWLRTPLVLLLTRPEAYDGKTVGVAGYLSTDFEDSRLYLTKDFGDLKVHENGIGVEYKKTGLHMRVPASRRKLDTFHHRFVVVSGRFRSKDLALHDVSVISPLWTPPVDR